MKMKMKMTMTLAAALSVGMLFADPLVKDGETIAFIGDSITEFGNWPAGYVNMVVKALEVGGVKVGKVAVGHSAETSQNMADRFARDVVAAKPQWVTISCGVNDVARMLDKNTKKVDYAKYEKNVRGMLDMAQAAGIKPVLLTPTLRYEEKPESDENLQIVKLCAFLKEEAKARQIPIADLNALADHSGGAFGVIAPYHTELKPKSAKGGPGSAGWADAGVVCPWMLYRKYGDRAALERSAEPIERYVDLQDTVPTPPTIGDHLALGKRKTKSSFVSEALRIEMMRLAILVDRTLGRDAQARHFAERRAARLAEFRAKWFDADGELKERTQTSAAFAIVYGLAPDAAAREKARRLLVAEIRAYDTHLTTGFLGTPVLLRALTEVGETTLAYELLEQTTCPSWLYPVTMGATSVWERWDAIRPDGTHHPDWMNSFNHYAFGSAASWLYDTVCGIRDLTEEDPSAAGWRRFRLAPQPDRRLGTIDATYKSAAGTIKSAWRYEGEKWVWNFTIPEGTTAEVQLPNAEKPTVYTAGTYEIVQ